MRLSVPYALLVIVGSVVGCDKILGLETIPEDAGAGAGASTGAGSSGQGGVPEDKDPVVTTMTTTSSGHGGAGCVVVDAGKHDSGGTCGDCVINGDETDLDCGGRLCKLCDPKQNCIVGEDCANGACIDGGCH